MRNFIKALCTALFLCSSILFSVLAGAAVSGKAKTGMSILEPFAFSDVSSVHSQRRFVLPGGSVFGIRLYTDGVIVSRTDEVVTAKGKVNPANDAGLEVGDIITGIGGNKVERVSDVSSAFEKSGGKPIAISVERDGDSLVLEIYPALSSADGRYRAGIWIRDSSAGIGTMTFIEPESGIFGGLGHAVCDTDTGKLMPLADGDAVTAKVSGCYKGTAGKPGEFCGIFGSETIGSLTINGDTGVYGLLDSVPKNLKQIPVALNSEIKRGAAQIITTVDGEGADYYDIEIEKVSKASDDSQRNMTIRVTDERLIEKTGGIVQGMSGSPIIQNGMLVGAVTHVFVSDPHRGYGIFAQSMLETASLVNTQLQKMAS